MSFELSEADAGSSPRFRATSVTDNLLPWYDMTLITVDVSEELILFYFASPYTCNRSFFLFSLRRQSSPMGGRSALCEAR